MSSFTKKWADLHSHTTASDGSLRPSELVQMAKERGLRALSITDHDTIHAYTEAIPAAVKLGVLLGVGVEFSTIFEGHDVHVLGYDFSLQSAHIHALCEQHQVRREHRNRSILEKLRAKGFEITFEELQLSGKEKTIGRPHIAQLMVEKGYVSSVKQAFYQYLGQGGSCYTQGEGFSVEETIRTIHAAQGKAFLAHPQLLPHSFPISRLLEQPFDGLECSYGNLSEKTLQPWIKMATKRNLLMSGGSDYHGPDHFLENSLGTQGVDEFTFYKIFKSPKS